MQSESKQFINSLKKKKYLSLGHFNLSKKKNK